MTTQSERDVAQEIAYVVEHGESPEADATRVLRRFMACKAGEDLVEHGLLRPYGYTLEPGRVISENRNLIDALETFEAHLAGEAHYLHDHPERAESVAATLASLCELMRRRVRESRRP